MSILILLKESIHIWLVKWSMKVNVVVKVYKKIKLGHCPPGPFIRFIRHTTFRLMILRSGLSLAYSYCKIWIIFKNGKNNLMGGHS